MKAKLRKRRRLGRWSGVFGGKQVIYAIDDGLEVDEIDGYEVTRRRVFWEDILLVTYHRKIGVAFPVITGIAAALFGLMAFGIGSASGDATTGVIVGAIFCTPFIIALGLRLALGVDIVTVFGRRTMARMRFSFLKARARRTFKMIIDRARHTQDEIARKHAEEDAARAAAGMPSAPAPVTAAVGPPSVAAETAAEADAEADGWAPPVPPAPSATPTVADAPSIPETPDAAAVDLTKRDSVEEQKKPAPPAVFEAPMIDDPDTQPGAGRA